MVCSKNSIMGTSNNSLSVAPAQAGVQRFHFTLSQFVQAQDVPRITKEELKKKLCSKNLMLIDVRVTQGWEQSNQKIKCATRMDPDNVSIWASTLPKDKEIVFYCS